MDGSPQEARIAKIVTYSSRLFDSHQAIFLPNRTGIADIGTLVHVTNDDRASFELEYKHGYSLVATQRKFLETSLGTPDLSALPQYVGPMVNDATPGSRMEQVAQEIELPKKGVKRSGVSSAFERNCKLTHLQSKQDVNCRDWLENYVARLEELSLLPPGASQAAASAPLKWDAFSGGAPSSSFGSPGTGF
jgi:hypothetical protein